MVITIERMRATQKMVKQVEKEEVKIVLETVVTESQLRDDRTADTK